MARKTQFVPLLNKSQPVDSTPESSLKHFEDGPGVLTLDRRARHLVDEGTSETEFHSKSERVLDCHFAPLGLNSSQSWLGWGREETRAIIRFERGI
jgi:hypothetical protein